MSSSVFEWNKQMKNGKGFETFELRSQGKEINAEDISVSYGELSSVDVTRLLILQGATKPADHTTKAQDNDEKMEYSLCDHASNEKTAAAPSKKKEINDASAANKHTKKVFYDLGTGCGQVPLQAFLEFTTLTKCVGIEVTDQRYGRAEENMAIILKNGYNGRRFNLVKSEKGKIMTIKEDFKAGNGKVIERLCTIWCGSLFDYPDGIKDADFCNIAVAFPKGVHGKFFKLILTTKPGCKMSLYKSLGSLSIPQNVRDQYLNALDYESYYRRECGGWGLYVYKRT